MPDLPGGLAALLTELKVTGNDPLARIAPLAFRELRRMVGAYVRQVEARREITPAAMLDELAARLQQQYNVAWLRTQSYQRAGARLMRCVLVEMAREKPGAGPALDPDRLDLRAAMRSPDALLALDRSLAELAATDPKQAEAYELHYFAGPEKA
jgi:hypothetical protein